MSFREDIGNIRTDGYNDGRYNSDSSAEEETVRILGLDNLLDDEVPISARRSGLDIKGVATQAVKRAAAEWREFLQDEIDSGSDATYGSFFRGDEEDSPRSKAEQAELLNAYIDAFSAGLYDRIIEHVDWIIEEALVYE